MTRALAVVALVSLSCSPIDGTVEPPDLDFNRMLEQPRYDSYEASLWFDDGAAMREPPEGTVAFAAEGIGEQADPPPSRMLLERGRRKFETVCAACHGVVGNGDTPVAHRMRLRPAPSLHSEKARGFSDQVIREIIRDGYGLMPSYAQHLEREDRFAVVYYLRALQLSQHAVVAELPPDVRDDAQEALR